MTDWGAHHLDVAQWALNMDQSGPIAVVATSEPPDPRPNCYTCHPHFQVTYRYANGTTVYATSRKVQNDSNQINGVRFDGEDGKWLFVRREGITASDPRIISEPLPGNAMRLPNFNSQMRNFIDCVRSRQQPICNYEVGHRSVSVCHLGNIAIRTGLNLRWNPETERFIDNDEANLWLGREMRPPWRLDV
jgi:predicted dehydrogenase